MIQLKRTNYKNIDFIKLVKHLDADLKVRDGDRHDFYHQFNSIEGLNHAVLAYKNDAAIGCGAFKIHRDDFVEVKRMYVLPNYRRQGIANLILIELEKWAKALNFEKIILETGKQQPEAVELYKKANYAITANFGMYKNVENSVCFTKTL